MRATPWFERLIPPLDGEPGLEQPCPSRCGRVQELEGAVVLHFCTECGAWGAYGYEVNLRAGRLGRWYCAAHRPQASRKDNSMTKTMTDDEMQRMPWTRGLMNKEELQQWFASRIEAGRAIDIETCELGCWAAYDFDPYGVDPDLPEEMQQVGTNRFVRSPESRGWVHEGDLPPAKGKSMYDRIAREADTYVNYLKRPKDPPELWQAKHDLWRVVENFACFIKWKDENRAAAVCELQELGEHLRRWQELNQKSG